MQVAILGPVEVRGPHTTRIEVPGTRLRALLIRLALDAGRPVGVANLVEAIWADEPPADPANALQTLVSRLRRAFGDPGAVTQSPAGYCLRVDPADVDALRFERLLDRGRAALRSGDPAQAAELFGEAVALWRGDAFADIVPLAPALQAPALRLGQLHTQARLDRIEAAAASEGAAAGVAELEALAAAHPLDERIAGLLMRALAAGGRQAEALARYEQLRRALADELGADPSAGLQELHLQLLREPARPAGASARPRSNLRAQLTSFVGRDSEVARIGKLLETSRLLTLVGPGGAGKTRLAGEAARHVLDAMPDGVWMVELAPVSDPADVAQTVLGALGLREVHLLDRRNQPDRRDALARLEETLAERAALLILDNCEHLVEAAAVLAEQLLGRCPRLRVLATSREPLGITGEALLVVPPLGQPTPDATAAEALEFPAVRLLADRAAAVRRGFTIDESTVADIVEIVRRLDGLPLAIELAAARLRTLPLAEVAARLSDRFRLLTGGSRTALPRHRTLRAVVEWSWDLLSPAERLLAERIAIFAGGVTTQSATAVCAGAGVEPADVPDLLASLVDKSLLQPVSPGNWGPPGHGGPPGNEGVAAGGGGSAVLAAGGGTRLRMLETIREYGVERLAERGGDSATGVADGELPALRARHADHFAALLEQAQPHLLTRDQLPWFALLGAERDNLMAALRFRCDVGDADGALEIGVSVSALMMMLGNQSEAPLWLTDALSLPGGTDVELRWIAVAVLALGSADGGGARSSEEAEAGLRALREHVEHMDGLSLGRHPLVGLLRAAIAFFAGDLDRSRRFIDEALAEKSEWTRASVLLLRANLAENNGDIAGMRADVDRALEIFRRLGERWGQAGALRLLGLSQTYDGDLEDAQATYDEALRLMRELNSHDDEIFVRMRKADLFLRTGDIAAAQLEADLSSAAAQLSGSPLEHLLATLLHLGIARANGDLGRAAQLGRDAIQRCAVLPEAHPMYGHVHAIVLAGVGDEALLRGDIGRGTDLLHRAVALAVGTRDMPIVASTAVPFAGLLARIGRPAMAAKVLGIADGLRGSPDRSHVEIARLTRELTETLGAAAFAGAYEGGHALAREAALDELLALSADSGVFPPPGEGNTPESGQARRR